MSTQALLLTPATLAEQLDDPDLRLVDMRAAERYAEGHLPGALHLDYADIVRQAPPMGGLLPAAADFAARLGTLGIGNGHRVVAYDDEGSGRAGRMLWTMHAFDRHRVAVLDGGFPAWSAAGLPLDRAPAYYAPASFSVGENPAVVADYDYIHARLGDRDTVLLDARSAPEYHGEKRRAEHAGHIPGAVHLEWTELMDPAQHRRLKPAPALRALLRARGIDAGREVIVYCHTHHRSALSYLALRALEYPRVRGYAGSWSDWGNRPNAPVQR